MTPPAFDAQQAAEKLLRKAVLGAALVQRMLDDPSPNCFAHLINLCEAYYDPHQGVRRP